METLKNLISGTGKTDAANAGEGSHLAEHNSGNTTQQTSTSSAVPSSSTTLDPPNPASKQAAEVAMGTRSTPPPAGAGFATSADFTAPRNVAGEPSTTSSALSGANPAARNDGTNLDTAIPVKHGDNPFFSAGTSGGHALQGPHQDDTPLPIRSAGTSNLDQVDAGHTGSTGFNNRSVTPELGRGDAGHTGLTAVNDIPAVGGMATGHTGAPAATGAGVGTTAHTSSTSTGTTGTIGTTGLYGVQGPHQIGIANAIDPNLGTAGQRVPLEDGLSHDPKHGGGAEAADAHHASTQRSAALAPGAIGVATHNQRAADASMGHTGVLGSTHDSHHGRDTALATGAAPTTGHTGVRGSTQPTPDSHHGRDTALTTGAAATAGAGVAALATHHDHAGQRDFPLKQDTTSTPAYAQPSTLGTSTAAAPLASSTVATDSPSHVGSHEKHAHDKTKHEDHAKTSHHDKHAADHDHHHKHDAAAGAAATGVAAHEHKKHDEHASRSGTVDAENPAPNTTGPHKHDWMNKLDPRVKSQPKSEVTGSNTTDHHGRDAAVAGGLGASAATATVGHGHHKPGEPGFTEGDTDQHGNPIPHSTSNAPAALQALQGTVHSKKHDQAVLPHGQATTDSDFNQRGEPIGHAHSNAPVVLGALHGTKHEEAKHHTGTALPHGQASTDADYDQRGQSISHPHTNAPVALAALQGTKHEPATHHASTHGQASTDADYGRRGESSSHAYTNAPTAMGATQHHLGEGYQSHSSTTPATSAGAGLGAAALGAAAVSSHHGSSTTEADFDQYGNPIGRDRQASESALAALRGTTGSHQHGRDQFTGTTTGTGTAAPYSRNTTSGLGQHETSGLGEQNRSTAAAVLPEDKHHGFGSDHTSKHDSSAVTSHDSTRHHGTEAALPTSTTTNTTSTTPSTFPGQAMSTSHHDDDNSTSKHHLLGHPKTADDSHGHTKLHKDPPASVVEQLQSQSHSQSQARDGTVADAGLGSHSNTGTYSSHDQSSAHVPKDAGERSQLLREGEDNIHNDTGVAHAPATTRAGDAPAQY